MRDVAIIGVGMIPFGRRDEDSLLDMLAYSSLKALDDAGQGDGGVDAVYVANMGAGILQHQTSVASALVDRLGLLPAAADVVENGPAPARQPSRMACWQSHQVIMTWCWLPVARRCVKW